MTGFARREVATPQGSLLWELRSVNSRHLEVQLKLPELFRPLEQDFRQLAGSRLGRGRVEAILTLRNGETRQATTRLNLPLARQVLAHAATVAAEMDRPAEVSPLELLRWPGVLEQDEADPAPLLPVALEALGQGLDELEQARSREGARIAEMLGRRLDEIDERVVSVIGRLPTVLARIREKLAERITSLSVPVDRDRVEQELVLIAQKLDVSEELDRLRSHLAEFRDGLRQSTPVGRRLDFLVQELNREANTLASKSADAETTRQAVDIKVLIEQIREQVQNVE